MSIQFLDTHVSTRVNVRSMERDTFTEYFVTGTVENGSPAQDAAEALFGSVAATLGEAGILPIQEKVYGVSQKQEEILAAREAAYRTGGVDPSLPATFIDGAPAGGSEFGGVQVWGIVPRRAGTRIETVDLDGRPVGRSITGPGFRMLHLARVTGALEDGTLPPGVTPQGHRMFATALERLRSLGYEYTQVARTWIYLARILDWYGEFNRVRTEHHDRVGVGRDGVVFPASTGIQGRSAGAECFMDVLAVDESGGGAHVHPHMKSPRQDPAYDYGSAFARSSGLEIEGKSTIFVSGTASIDGAGETLYFGDAEAQTVETLLTIGALLEEQGAGLRDITLSTVFCKNEKVYEAFLEVKKLLGLPEFPAICVIADVCRPELLIEIEAIATQAQR